MEVKGRIDTPEDIVKDFKTITTFVDRYQYQLGIFLLYNHSFGELSEYLSNFEKVSMMPEINNTLVITKEAHNKPAEVIKLNQKSN